MSLTDRLRRGTAWALGRRARGAVSAVRDGASRRAAAPQQDRPPQPPVVLVPRPAGPSSDTPPRYTWPAYPPPGYLGQLTDDFQRSLAAEREFLTLEDCEYYHATDLMDGRFIPGPWDLRGREHLYLGGIDLAGLRVLELGPASGGLTFWMEAQGADVVALDAGYDVMIDLLPLDCTDWRGVRMDHVKVIGGVQNSWWYTHRDRGSRARMVYGPIYDLPGDLGTFDVSVFGAILLHLRRPFDALEQAARRTTGAIVVTEAYDLSQPTHDDDRIRFNPTDRLDQWTVWWSFTPRAVEKMLHVLGFRDTTVTEHAQPHHHGHDMTKPPSTTPMFTVVGRR